jgi:sulfur-oxidizing protein SoxX
MPTSSGPDERGIASSRTDAAEPGMIVRRARLMHGRMTVICLIAAICATAAVSAESASAFDGDRIDQALDGLQGDPARGRTIVADRSRGLCLLCHSGPFPEERQQGNLAPDLSGAGSRLSPAQLRARIVDSRRINPQSIMPAYHRIEGLERVAPTFRGRPIFDAQQVEDVVAYLLTLRNAPGDPK